MVQRSFVAEEVEQLVLANGATDCATELVVNLLGLPLSGGKKERLRLELIVGVILETGSMHCICTALDLHIDGATTSQALLRVKTVGDDIDAIDGFQRRDVRGDMR